MIGFLSGSVRAVFSQYLILMTGGVGYTVFVPHSQNYLPSQLLELYIHTHVREDAITLFGFPEENSLQLFESLLTVGGVGPKSALAILSAANSESIISAIKSDNLNFFTAISGIGKKSAQKIILDLKPRLSRSSVNLSSLEGDSELNTALKQLGYNDREILNILPKVDMTQDLASQIKQSLKLLKS